MQTTSSFIRWGCIRWNRIHNKTWPPFTLGCLRTRKGRVGTRLIFVFEDSLLLKVVEESIPSKDRYFSCFSAVTLPGRVRLEWGTRGGTQLEDGAFRLPEQWWCFRNEKRLYDTFGFKIGRETRWVVILRRNMGRVLLFDFLDKKRTMRQKTVRLNVPGSFIGFWPFPFSEKWRERTSTIDSLTLLFFLQFGGGVR